MDEIYHYSCVCIGSPISDDLKVIKSAYFFMFDFEYFEFESIKRITYQCVIYKPFGEGKLFKDVLTLIKK